MHSKRNPHRPRRGWLFVTAVAATIVLAMKYRRNLRQR